MTPQIALAMEIPTVLLREVGPTTGLDFALAPTVLEDKAYCSYYAGRPANRRLILDNGMHELGEALPIGELVEAAAAVMADYVIAPDRLDDAPWTVAQYHALRKRIPQGRVGIAVNLVGRTHHEREFFLASTSSADMLCLPYRRNRLEWFWEHWMSIRHGDRIHLLGLQSLDEARAWARVAVVINEGPVPVLWSLDTSKPVKWGLIQQDIGKLENLRGCPVGTRELMQLRRVEPKDLAAILRNVETLTACLRP